MLNTTNDWQQFLFSSTEVGDIPNDWDNGLLQKAQYDTSVDGHVNSVFMSALYAQYNQENKFYSAIPQVDRFEVTNLDSPVAPKAFRAAHSPIPLQTHSEGGVVPDGERFDVDPVDFEPKRSVTVAEVSDLQQIYAMIEDAVGYDEFWEMQQDQLDLAIDRDGVAQAVTAGSDQYSAVDTITPLDRAIASGDEQANAQDPDGTAYNPGDLDYGSVTRATDSYGDSFVDFDATSTRQLNVTLMDTFLNSFNESADVNVYRDTAILTGHDTARVLSQIAADNNKVRTMVDATDSGTTTVGDTETIEGVSGMTRFRDYDGIPIVANQHAPAHGDLSSIYVISTDTINGEPRIAVENYNEPYVETSGRGQSQGFLATGNFREEALMKMDHELVIRDFSSQAKLRDLSE